MKRHTVIIGAGLAGLLCACAFDGADIYEAGRPIQQHRALLRFRDESVSKLTAIPFRSVEVHKEIWHDGQTFRHCSNRHANMYALKVTGTVAGRSIRSLDTVTRYVAPNDFYQRLIDRHASRINWESPVNRDFIDVCKDRQSSIINTAPLHVILDLVREHGSESSAASFPFDRRAIKVARFDLDPALVDVYQTIYYPGSETDVYRASITGHTVIIEAMGDIDPITVNWVMDHFGIPSHLRAVPVEYVDQRYGKIKDIPTDVREALLYELTRDHGIYSVGRFATWRNILLDDVVDDIHRVGRLINASDYGRALIGAL